ncbi:MAG: hypothetical protein ACON5H_05150 [Akkermansiaceae bacterium]
MAGNDQLALGPGITISNSDRVANDVEFEIIDRSSPQNSGTAEKKNTQTHLDQMEE